MTIAIMILGIAQNGLGPTLEHVQQLDPSSQLFLREFGQLFLVCQFEDSLVIGEELVALVSVVAKQGVALRILVEKMRNILRIFADGVSQAHGVKLSQSAEKGLELGEGQAGLHGEGGQRLTLLRLYHIFQNEVNFVNSALLVNKIRNV